MRVDTSVSNVRMQRDALFTYCDLIQKIDFSSFFGKIIVIFISTAVPTSMGQGIICGTQIQNATMQ